MFNLGMGEITVILLLALIFIGPKKLPELASGLGRFIREIRKTTADVKNEIQLDESIRRPFEELRDAVTLPPAELKRRDRLKRELEELQKQAALADQLASAAEGDAAGTETPGITSSSSAEPTHDADHALPPTSSEPEPSAGVEPTAHVHHESPAVAALAAVSTEEPFPTLFGAAPVGTVSRGSTLPPPPPQPPGSGDRKTHAPPNSDLMKALRKDGRKTPPVSRPALAGPPPMGAADASNTTQILSDADLAAVAATPPPPPPRQTGRGMAAVPPPLPGATPPKTPTSSS